MTDLTLYRIVAAAATAATIIAAATGRPAAVAVGGALAVYALRCAASLRATDAHLRRLNGQERP